MKQIMPQEIEVWYLIPALRKELALAMSENGLKQVEIAKRLGITKPAVSQYLQDKRGGDLTFSKKMKDKIKESAKSINNQFEAIKELQSLLNSSKKEKVLCQIHKKLSKDFCKCNVCFERGAC